MGWMIKPKQKKYLEGPPISSILDLCVALNGDAYLWWRGRPYHPRIIANWSWSGIYSCWLSGTLKYAAINPEWKPKEQDTL